MGHTLHKMEMARVRFLISAYLRIRLAKIEKNIFHILDEVAQAQEAGQTHRKLTKDELKFAQVGSSTFPTFNQTLSQLTKTDYGSSFKRIRHPRPNNVVKLLEGFGAELLG